MLPSAPVQWLSKNKLIIELLLVALVVIAVLMNHYIEGSPTVLMLAMFLLATFYFISAYLVPETSGLLSIVSTKVVSISSSVCVIGLLFTILKFQGASQMLMIGTLSIFLAGVILLISGIKSWDQKIVPLLARVVVLGSISASTLLTLMERSGEH